MSNEPKVDIEKYFLVPNFKVIATYPGGQEKIGQLICPSTHKCAEPYTEHPAIYQKLEWWENRELTELMYIEFIEVKIKGYYVPGDKLRVHNFIFEGLDTRNPKIVGFAASINNSRGNHNYKLNECIPATEAKLLNP